MRDEKEFSRKYREKNPTYHKDRCREKKRILIQYKGGCCKDCGEKFPDCCFDFDHLFDKKFNVSHRLGGTLEKLIVEADKCDLVCANCHRIRTQARY
jgi:hypothetical protein